MPCPSQAVAELLLDSVGLTLEATLVTPPALPVAVSGHGICLIKATSFLTASLVRQPVGPPPPGHLPESSSLSHPGGLPPSLLPPPPHHRALGSEGRTGSFLASFFLESSVLPTVWP